MFTRIASSLLAVAALAIPAAAEPAPKTFGIDGALALPTGDWSDRAGIGIGALARFELAVMPALTVTGRVGYVQHLGKDFDSGVGGEGTSSAGQIPLLGGVRYAFTRGATSQIYGAAELGLVIYRAAVEVGDQEMSDSQTNLGLTLGAGYRTGKLDLRAGLMFPDLGEAGDALAVMASVGYDLAAF